MTDVTTDFLIIAVDVVVSAAFIASILAIVSGMHTINASVMERQSETQALRHYRTYNQFDFKHVYQADIVGAVFRTRGIPEVQVQTSTNTYKWDAVSAPCEYSTDQISALIPNDKLWDATVVKSANGEIIRYEFTIHHDGCGR